VVEDLNEAEWTGTADARRALCDDQVSRFGTPRDVSILFVHNGATGAKLENFTRAVRNIEGIEVLALDEVQVWHVLKYQWTVLESSVVQALEPETGEEAEVEEEEYNEEENEDEVEREEEQRI
jgi:large subunit ribosomal protein L4